MQALRKVPHAEAKEEPGLRFGKQMATQVVTLAVMRRMLGRCTPGYTALIQRICTVIMLTDEDPTEKPCSLTGFS